MTHYLAFCAIAGNATHVYQDQERTWSVDGSLGMRFRLRRLSSSRCVTGRPWPAFHLRFIWPRIRGTEILPSCDLCFCSMVLKYTNAFCSHNIPEQCEKPTCYSSKLGKVEGTMSNTFAHWMHWMGQWLVQGHTLVGGFPSQSISTIASVRDDNSHAAGNDCWSGLSTSWALCLIVS